MKRTLIAAGLALAAFAWHGTARATPVVGNESIVTLVVDVGSLGVTVAPTGTATVDPIGRYVLPVTGGDVTFNPLAGFILHEGSGLSFTRDTSNVTVANLRVDFTSGVVTGDVSGTVSTGNMDLFNIVPCDNGGCTDGHGGIPVTEKGLFLTSNGANLFNGLYTSPVVTTGDQVGLAEIHLRLEGGVPEPTTLLLMGIGLAGLALVRTRHSAVSPSA